MHNQGVGAILDNYADVIEGGNTWRGSGTEYYGIPGTQPNDYGLKSGDDSPLTVAEDSASTSIFSVTKGSYPWESTETGNPFGPELLRWMPSNAPAFWAMCNTAGGNYGAARKISSVTYQPLWSELCFFAVTDAYPATPSEDDSMVMLQGFKRLPDNVPPDVEGDGWDRFFALSMDRGERLEWFGNGLQTYKGTLELRLRIVKYGRHHDAVASALENLAIIDAAITRGANPDHRDGTYTRALLSEGAPEIETEDATKVVAVAKYGCIYRIGSAFL